MIATILIYPLILKFFDCRIIHTIFYSTPAHFQGKEDNNPININMLDTVSFFWYTFCCYKADVASEPKLKSNLLILNGIAHIRGAVIWST